MANDKNRHTPSPWEFEHSTNTVWAKDYRPAICKLHHYRSPEETEANGLLIAASPQLAKELEISQAWIAKFIADRPENDPTGLKERAQKQYDKNSAILEKATL